MPRKVFSLKVLLVLVVMVIALSELVIPTLLSNAIARGIMIQTGSENASAKAQNSPALFMLSGRFKEIRIQTVNTKLDKVSFSEMQAVLKDVQIDMGALSSRRVNLKSVGDVDLEATITQDELARIVNTTVKGAANAKVNISPTGVKVTSSLALGQLVNVALGIEGKIVTEGQKIKLVTQKFTVNNMLVGNIGGAMFTEIPLVDVKKLPFGVSLRNVVMDEGKVMIYADNRK